MKKTKLFLLLTTLSNLIVFSLHAQILEQTFEDQAAHFKITLPNGQWHMEPRGTDPGKLRWVAKFESPLDLFLPNVTLRTEPLSQPSQTAEEWFQNNLKPIEENLAIYTKEKIVKNGITGFELISIDTENDIIFYQQFFQSKNQHYILTATSKRASFFRLEEDFKKIFNSLEII